MTVLDDIVADVRVDLERRMSEVSLDDLKQRAGRAPAPLDAEAVLREPGVSVNWSPLATCGMVANTCSTTGMTVALSNSSGTCGPNCSRRYGTASR